MDGCVRGGAGVLVDLSQPGVWRIFTPFHLKNGNVTARYVSPTIEIWASGFIYYILFLYYSLSQLQQRRTFILLRLLNLFLGGGCFFLPEFPPSRPFFASRSV